MNPSHTKESWAEYMREYRKRKPHIIKSIDLKKKYGISLEEFQLMLDVQGNVCKVCGQPEKAVHRVTKQPVSLSVDHCHTTGKIRGLLCSNCNTALGLLKENISIMENLMTYIKETGA